jgi:hypothetical protein
MKEWQVQGFAQPFTMNLPLTNIDTTFERFLQELPEDY